LRRTQKIDKSSGLIDGRTVVIEVREVGGVTEVEVEKVGGMQKRVSEVFKLNLQEVGKVGCGYIQHII
jgi:hypothetical protein